MTNPDQKKAELMKQYDNKLEVIDTEYIAGYVNVGGQIHVEHNIREKYNITPKTKILYSIYAILSRHDDSNKGVISS